jgi:hypothetical protein
MGIEIDNSGGPAFPCEHYDYYEMGMTLRDWFAGQALTGLAADTSNVHAHLMAKAAYIIADRMLEERKRRDGND